jgi:hypothetical protein
MYETFPALRERMASVKSKISSAANEWLVHQTCADSGLCPTLDVAEALMGEAPLDLTPHIEIVNSNPNSTWKAGINEKFSGASKKEVQQILGTVVDREWVLNGQNSPPPALFSDDLPANFDSRV